MTSGKENAESVDEILNGAGPWGFLQVMIHLIIFYVELMTTGHIVIPFFTGHNPPWRCISGNSSSFCSQHINKTITINDEVFSRRCSLNRSEWSYMTSKSYSFVTEFDLICEKTSTAAFVSSCVYIGCLLGALLMGPIGDAFGRKRLLLFSVILLPFPCLATGIATSIWQLCVLNVIIGITSTTCYMPTYVYLTEICPPSYRSISLNILNLFVFLSYVCVDVFALYYRKWRLLTMIMGLVIIPVWIPFCFLPESPRWLLIKGRQQEAEHVLRRIVRSNEALNLKISAFRQTESKGISYITFFRKPKILKVTLSMVSLWVSIPILYYCISAQVLDLGGNMYLNFALPSCADVFAFFAASFLSYRFGRKTMTLGCTFISGILLGCVLLIPKIAHHRIIVVMCLTVAGRIAISISFYGMYIWTNEVFPTIVRSQGLSICSGCEKIAMISLPFITKILQRFYHNLPFILMSVLGIAGAILGLPLPETKGQVTREDFDDICDEKPKEGEVIVTGVYNTGNEIDHENL